jgi:hypothetical protein
MPHALGVAFGEQQSTIFLEETKVKHQDLNEVIFVGDSSHMLEMMRRTISDQHTHEAVLDAERE